MGRDLGGLVSVQERPASGSCCANPTTSPTYSRWRVVLHNAACVCVSRKGVGAHCYDWQGLGIVASAWVVAGKANITTGCTRAVLLDACRQVLLTQPSRRAIVWCWYDDLRV